MTERKQLEWELSQDSRHLESNGWYHGPIPRSHAESLVLNDGDFLVRDSTSGKPGDVVLSLHWKNDHLHFIISKVIVQAYTVYESIQYRLEDEAFDSIADLITCYVASNKSVTMATGAKMITPINRSLPLSVYGTIRPDRGSTSNIYSGGRLNASIDYATFSLPRLSAQDRYHLRRRPSDPSIHPEDVKKELPTIPVKPSRVSSVLYPSTEDIGNGGDSSGSQIPLPELPARPLTLPRLRKNLNGSPWALTGNRRSCDLEVEASFGHHLIPESGIPEGPFARHFPTLFQLDSFQTALLPAEDIKPLDAKTFEAVLQLFEDHSVKSMALHLLHSDLDVLGGLDHQAEAKRSFPYESHYANRGITSGIELCTLPNGQQLRADLMQRTQCLRLFVAVTILICQSVEERTAMLNYWIEIAIESKTALGNMYSFAAILLGLTMPQIERLKETWNLLRQKHTGSAYTFEARLRPMLKPMADGSNPHAPNTTIPDLHSAILIWQATLESFLDDGVSIPCLNFHLTTSGPDYGLDLFNQHLNLIRSWSLNLPTYLRNSRTALTGFQPDQLVLDMFRTEFQLQFLWGSRGALSANYSKMDKVLEAFSQRWEPFIED